MKKKRNEIYEDGKKEIMKEKLKKEGSNQEKKRQEQTLKELTLAKKTTYGLKITEIFICICNYNNVTSSGMTQTIKRIWAW